MVSDSSIADTDNDGLNDDAEIRSENQRVVSATELCLDTEIRLSNIAGKDYCINIEYNSYPTLLDSDNDGVADRSFDSVNNIVTLDHFPLDPSCHLASDGFVNPDLSVECFSSWMSGENTIEIIESIEWNESGSDRANVLLYASGWGIIVRYNLLTKAYELPIVLSRDLKDIAFDATTNELYFLYEDSIIESYDLETGTIQVIGDYALADNNAEQIITMSGGRLFLQLQNEFSGVFTSKLINVSSGAELSDFAGHNLMLSDNTVLCSGLDCKVYGFVTDENDASINVNVGAIDIQSNSIVSNVQVSSTLDSSESILGPIKLSEDQGAVYLGSGQILALDTLNKSLVDDLAIEHKGDAFNQYYDFASNNNHFVGIVNFDTQAQPGSPEVSTTNNGTLVKDFSSDQVTKNTYLIPPVSLEEQILKLLSFSNTNELDVVYVSKFSNSTLIENFGLNDQDGDGMPAIYEIVNGLDDSDATDKYSDPDGDNLVNIEEYLFATDPQSTDTDQDGWSDLYEVLNNTSPVDALDF